MKLAKAIIVAVALATSAGAQSDSWAPLRFFVGKWEGQASGEPGRGASSREYRFELNSRFITVRNKSVYEPKAPAKQSEVHEDFGLFSYDQAQKKFVLRQFHGEGFVNEYILDAMSGEGQSLEFVTTRIENIPIGWRAKERYRVVSSDEFVETFSLAAPGKDFEVYSETHLKRVK